MVDIKWNDIKFLLWKHGKCINLCLWYRHYIPLWHWWSLPLPSPFFSGNLSLKLPFPLPFWLALTLKDVVMLHTRTAQWGKASFCSHLVVFSTRAQRNFGSLPWNAPESGVSDHFNRFLLTTVRLSQRIESKEIHICKENALEADTFNQQLWKRGM